MGLFPCLSLFAQLEWLDPSICERVTPRLSHANSAVVLSAVKVLMKFMEMLSKDLDYYSTLLKKLAPPLVTLLSAEPELQYVALRNINLIVQKRYRDQHTCMLHARDRDPQGKLICHHAESLKSTRGFSTRALSLQRTLDKK